MATATGYPDHRLISSEQGTEVYGSDRSAIGEIDHLFIDKLSGRVAYAVMSFGGFLGLGHSHYPIPWAALSYDTGLGGFRTNITESQLKDARNSATTYGLTGHGRPRPTNTMGYLDIGEREWS